MAHVVDGLGNVLAAHDADALLEDDLALVVHHIVEFEQVLADVEVARLDLLLRLFERLVDPRMDDRLVLLEAEGLQHRVHALGAEDAHEIVIEREIEQRAAGIALAAGAAAQLVVDAAALMALGADDEEAAGADHLLLVALDFGLDLFLAAACARPRRSMPCSSIAMRISALPPSLMSVPRPAMLVAMVTAPGTPACAMICASCS